MNKFIGHMSPVPDLVDTFKNFARKDRLSAIALEAQGFYRAAAFHYHQGAEMLIKSKIVKELTNLSNPNIRASIYSHNLLDSIGILLDLLPGNQSLKAHIIHQIRNQVLTVAGLRHLSINCRYPAYLPHCDTFMELHIGKQDCRYLRERLSVLAEFIKQLNILS